MKTKFLGLLPQFLVRPILLRCLFKKFATDLHCMQCFVPRLLFINLPRYTVHIYRDLYSLIFLCKTFVIIVIMQCLGYVDGWTVFAQAAG